MKQKKEVVNKIAHTIKDLRISKGLTQQQLADKLGLSVSSIKHYELGNREPNSKAMVALEKFFNVSGEFLRGNLDKDTFYKNSELINDGLDDIIDLFLIFKSNFSIMSQSKQLIASGILKECLSEINNYMIKGDEMDFFNAAEFTNLLKCFSSLNPKGQEESVKRVHELTLLPQYSKS